MLIGLADDSTLWMWINAVIDIQIQRHRKEIEGASFHALVNVELERYVYH